MVAELLLLLGSGLSIFLLPAAAPLLTAKCANPHVQIIPLVHTHTHGEKAFLML